MPGTISFMQQSFPGKPQFTESNVPDLKGTVTIVTGSDTGLGKEIAQILYSKNAKVYMMARSKEKTQKAINSIKATVPMSSGELISFLLTLQISGASRPPLRNSFTRNPSSMSSSTMLVLGIPSKAARRNRAYDLQLGVNCIGTFAFTKHLTPTLVSTAKTSPPNSIRVVWVSSSAAEAIAPKGYIEKLNQY
ncbi:hypothetical protein MPDQ_007212 [Monascus purpureus]|uniref:Uncharacterized protein n=1 Tax=Monascus purpureus TaxID=5098 RepID=A0A507QWI5_MONPU|nr:hypothetical protein MPDQ_007212 [Monascus purpureus]BDD60838.1 hypothetical protein MAP00_005934 [Monascus purpureus]